VQWLDLTVPVGFAVVVVVVVGGAVVPTFSLRKFISSEE
jgi:flagellar motor component MotA